MTEQSNQGRSASHELAAMRKDYRRAELLESDAAGDPMEQFARWFSDAISGGVSEASAMTLSTADAGGRPAARIVLLKGHDESGFVFFTNYLSRKGRDLAQNSRACLTFFWPQLERQIRIDGTVTKTTRAESEAYFHSRPTGSQIGAWASAQSSVIPSRAVLEAREAELAKQFAGKMIPLPEAWGGYRLKPCEFEFWQGRPSRLHDRLRYSPVEGDWKIERLAP